jgi:RNA polymerase sigma-70 factor (ECF subfamily)
VTAASDASFAELYEAGRGAWPSLELAADRFAAFVSRRGPGLVALRGPDLYLACACAHRVDRAAALFTAEFGADLERAAVRIRAPGVSPEDARQMLLHRILVGDEERRPKIESYSGRGSLRNWVRAVAARAAIDLHRKGGHRELGATESLLETLTDSADPEIEYLKRHYRDQFNRAFEAAVNALPARSRNYLRHAFIDRLTIDQVAALYGVHRATAARRLAAARDALLAATRTALIEQLEIGETELDSIMRLIGSRFEVSVQRIFAGDAEPGEP